MRIFTLSAVAVLGLLIAESSVKAQVVVGVGGPRVGVTVGVPGPYYYQPYPAVAYPSPYAYAAPGAVVATPAVGVSVGVVGAPMYRPYPYYGYGGYYGPYRGGYYRYHR